MQAHRQFAAGLMFAGLLGQAGAQVIYTCVDAQGRRLTADRPIAECMDREQREFDRNGILRRTVGPQLTATERAAQEAKARREAEERNRVAEEKRRERALVTRYPDKSAHDKERASALRAADDAIAVAAKNVKDLATQRRKLDTELEFYKGDTARVPAPLKRQIEENDAHLDAQKRFIANQDSEKKRINARFDEELAKLKGLWAQRGSPPISAAQTAAARP